MWRDGVGFCRFLTRGKIRTIIMQTARTKVPAFNDARPRWLETLTDDESRELLALFWFGRADFRTLVEAKRHVGHRDREELVVYAEHRDFSRFLKIGITALDGGPMPDEVINTSSAAA